MFRILALRRKLVVLTLLLCVASLSYGFAMWKEAQAGAEYRQMIYDISKAMGESPGCMD